MDLGMTQQSQRTWPHQVMVEMRKVRRSHGSAVVRGRVAEVVAVVMLLDLAQTCASSPVLLDAHARRCPVSWGMVQPGDAKSVIPAG